MRPIHFELRCAQCGYDLRGRSPLGRCSECGLRVGATINATSLRERSSERLRSSFMAPTARNLLFAIMGLLTVYWLAAAARGMDGTARPVALLFAVLWSIGAAAAVGRYTTFLTEAPRSWNLTITVEILIVLLATSAAAGAFVQGGCAAPRALVIIVPVAIMPAISGLERGEAIRQRVALFIVQIPPAIALALGESGRA